MSKRNQRLKSTRAKTQQLNALRDGSLTLHTPRMLITEENAVAPELRTKILGAFANGLPNPPLPSNRDIADKAARDMMNAQVIRQHMASEMPYAYLPLQCGDSPDKSQVGLWHFCCMRLEDTWAVGYCAQMMVCPMCRGFKPEPRRIVVVGAMPQPEPCPVCENRGIVVHPDKCPGHDDEAGATAHFKQYVLDNADYLAQANVPLPCAICGASTNHGAYSVADFHAPLCREHNNRDGFAQAIGDDLCRVVPVFDDNGRKIIQA